MPESSDTLVSHRPIPWRDLRMEENHRPGDRNVRITDVKTMTLVGNFVWGIVKVETDADRYGIGEVYCGRDRASLEKAAHMGEYLRGQNPLDVERLAELLVRNYADTGRGQAGAAAITGIETALWDLKGKLCDLPVYELLGGKFRDEVKVYCDTHAGEALSSEADADPEDVYTPEAYARAANDVVSEGFEALKFDLDVVMADQSNPDAVAGRMNNAEVRHKVSLIEAVREEIGHDVDLGVDLHWNYSVETATRMGRALERFDLAWIEDPVPPGQFDAHREVRERVSTPILTGENIVTATEFDKLLSASALDIAAPDVAKCGGLGELRRIASFCEVRGVPIAPHNIASPVGTVAGAHACASIPNFLCLEYHARDVPWWEDLVTRTDGGGRLLEDGYLDLPEGPGLGIELDADVVAAHLAPDSDLIV